MPGGARPEIDAATPSKRRRGADGSAEEQAASAAPPAGAADTPTGTELGDASTASTDGSEPADPSQVAAARTSAESPNTAQEFDEEDYEVDRIVGKRKRASTLEYRVRWKGYGESDDTWEPLSHLDNASAKIKAFEQAKALSRGRGRGGRGRGLGRKGRKAKLKVPVATVVMFDSNGSGASAESGSGGDPGALAARQILVQTSRRLTEAWRVAALQSTEGSSVEPKADHVSEQTIQSPGPGLAEADEASAVKSLCQEASQTEDSTQDRPAQADQPQNSESPLQDDGKQIDEVGVEDDGAPLPEEPDQIRAGFAEVIYHPSREDQAKHNEKFAVRIATTEDGVTYVSIADFLEFIKVHNRLNAQSMASNLVHDAKKKQKYELLHGAINGSRRRTPMIRMADQFPKYVRSIGTLKALGSTLPKRDATKLWETYCNSSLREWFENELEKSTKVSGVLAEWTDEQWAHRTKQVTNSGSTATGRQSMRKRKNSRQGGTDRKNWLYRELSAVLVTLPADMNPGDTFSLRVPGVDALVNVEFPVGGVPGKQIELKLVDPIQQKILASDIEPGWKCAPCYDEQVEDPSLRNAHPRARPKNRVPSAVEIAAIRAEMQCQPGLQHADVSAGKESVPIPVVNTVDEERFDLNTFRYVATPEIPEKIQALIDAAPPVPCNCMGTCGGVGADLCSCVDRFGDVFDLNVKLELNRLPPNQRPASVICDSKEGATSAGRRRGHGAGVPRRVRARKVGESEWTTYPSVNQAHKGTGVDYILVHKCCRTSLTEIGGYVFEYDDNTAAETKNMTGGMPQETSSPTIAALKQTSAPSSSPTQNPTLESPGMQAAAETATFKCGALLAKAVADALGGLDVAAIHSDEDNHKTGGGLDGVASMQYKTQVDNETMSYVASLFATSVGDALDGTKHWYPDLMANSKMFPGTYVRLPSTIGRLAAGCYGLMNIAGTSLGPQEVKNRLENLQAANATWEATEVKATRYGAYHKGRLGPAISFSVIHECTDACGCLKLRQPGQAGGGEGCGNRHLQRGIRPDVLLEVFRAGTKKGWGLRSRTFIPAGTFVCEYVGEVMTDTEANERGRLKGPEYLFDLDVAVQRRHEERQQKRKTSQQKDTEERDDAVDMDGEDTQEFVRLRPMECCTHNAPAERASTRSTLRLRDVCWQRG